MADSPSELATAPLEPVGYLGNASNVTLLVRVGEQGHAVYKPVRGERPLWDFPPGTLARREVAAYRVSEALGWGFVPQTLLREGPLGEGSVQRFIDHDPASHYFTLVEQARFRARLAQLAVFDFLVNNADRKASHVMLDAHGELFGCDHGLTFHVEQKIRTVIWEFGGMALEPEWQADLARIAAELGRAGSVLHRELGELLASAEIEATRTRAELLSRTPCLPAVPEDRRPYPWPLL